MVDGPVASLGAPAVARRPRRRVGPARVFGFAHGEIAAAGATALLYVRSRFHLGLESSCGRRRGRAEVSASSTPRSPTVRDGSGDRRSRGLLGLLAPDVVLVTDGGGIKKAALRPIVGVEKVLRFLSAVRPAELSADAVMLNGEPCPAIFIAGELDGIFATRVVGGVVTELYGVRNPEKLSRLADPVPLSR